MTESTTKKNAAKKTVSSRAIKITDPKTGITKTGATKKTVSKTATTKSVPAGKTSDSLSETVVTLPKLWTLSSLPKSALEAIKLNYVVADTKAYRESSFLSADSSSLFAMFENESEKKSSVQVESRPVVWATEHYAERGVEYTNGNPIHDISVIVPRVEKTQAEQKRRVKEKAEVFTPLWLVNTMNNLVDEKEVAKDAFNIEQEKSWIPTSSPVKFADEKDWIRYIASRRLEMCGGEGPYLFSPYDPTTGTYLPVRDDDGRFQRIGLLDRKLRVASENAENMSEWEFIAQVAVSATFGFEWQGDNLLLARLNLINTYLDYWLDFAKASESSRPTRKQIETRTIEVAQWAAKQIWQMDGLRQTIPNTCSQTCVACKKRKRHGHDGVLPVITWGTETKVFESFLSENEQVTKK